MLFNITKTYFENWLRQMMGAALTLIIVAASIALLIGLLTSQLQNLLNYEVCNMVIWSMDLDLIDVHFAINFWYPSDSRVDTALSAKNLFSFLIFGAIFDSFSKQIPQICDILGKMGIGSIGAMYGATGQGLNRIKSGATQAAAGAVTVAKMAIAVKSGGTSKVVEGVAKGAEEAGKAAEKISKGVSSAAKKR